MRSPVPPCVGLPSHCPGCASNKRQGCIWSSWPFFFPPFFTICCGFCDGQPYGWSGPLRHSPLGDFMLRDIPIENCKQTPNRNSGCFEIPFSQTAHFHLSTPCAEKTIGPVEATGKQESLRGSWEGWSHPAMAWPFPAAPFPFLGDFCSFHTRGCSTAPGRPDVPSRWSRDPAHRPAASRLPCGGAGLGTGCRGLGGMQG